MAGFGIKLAQAGGCASDLDGYASLLITYTNKVDDISRSLNALGGSTSRIKASLRTVSGVMEIEQQKLKNMGKKLDEIVSAYEKTESKICDGTLVVAVELKDIGSLDPNKMDEDGGWLDDILDYIWTALKQVIAGDFVDDGNLLGTVLSIAIGFVPIVGQIADARDLVADVYNLIHDGPTAEEWVNLGFTLVGIIPGIGDFLKHGDEAADAVKAVFKNADKVDEMADAVKRFFHNGDEIFSAVGRWTDEFNDFFKHNVTDKIGDAIKNSDAGRWVQNGIESIKNSDVYKDVDRILDKVVYHNDAFDIDILDGFRHHIDEVNKSAKDVIGEIIDNYKEDFEKSTLTQILEQMGFPSEPEPSV